MGKMKTALGLLAGVGAGAAAMYFLDPERGGRRRAMVQDKLTSKAGRLATAATGLKHDLSNRAYGRWIETKKLFMRDENVSDDVLEARVRSKMGRIVTDAHAIDVRSENGDVTVSGSIPEAEIQPLLKKIRLIPGVSHIENRLNESADGDSANSTERIH